MTLHGGTAAGDPGDAQFSLPPADDAERWERLLPGSADRLISIMEALAIAKINNDQAVTERWKKEQELANTSLGYAGFLSFLLIVASIVFFAVGNSVAGGILLGVPAVGIAVSFIPKTIANRRTSDEE